MFKLCRPNRLVLLAAASCLLGGCHATTTQPARPVSQKAARPVINTGVSDAQNTPALPNGQRDQYGQPPLRMFPPMPNGDNKPLFLHNGRVIRTVSRGGTYRFWDVRTARLLRVQPTGRPYKVDYTTASLVRPYDDVSDDAALGALIVQEGSHAGDVQIWDIPRHRLLRTLDTARLRLPALRRQMTQQGLDVEECRVQFMQDARRCAICYESETIAVWDCRTGQVRWRKSLPRWAVGQKTLTVPAMLFSPDDSTLAVVQRQYIGHGFASGGDVYHFVTILDAQSGRIKRAWSRLDGGVGAYLLTPDNATFLDQTDVTADFTLTRRSIRTGRVHPIGGTYGAYSTRLKTETIGAAFAANGRQLATCLSDIVNYDDNDPLHVSVSDIPSGRCVAEYDFIDTTPAGYYMPDMALSPNGRMLAVTNRKGRLTLWQVPPVQTLARPNPPALHNKPAPIGEQIAVTK